MPITTSVTWQDLRDAQERELSDLREAYDELETLAQEEYGDDALTRPVPNDLGDIDDSDLLQRAAIHQQIQLLKQSRETVEQRLNLLSVLEDELGDGEFEIKMLSGQEAMQVEVDLRTDADAKEWDRQTLQIVRNQRTVDAAVVDAPEGVPRQDESPVPSECPNALVNTLFEQVQRFNSAGQTDFRPEGFGSPAPLEPSVSSATPTPSKRPSSESVTTDADAPERGNSS